MSEALVSLGAAMQAAARFRQLFKPAFVRWQTCGWVRRGQREGPLRLVHVAIPRAPISDFAADNALWERAAELIAARKVQPVALASGAVSAPEPEAVLLQLDALGASGATWRHELIRTSPDAWGSRLVQHTGPPGYWRMLIWRLEHAGTLKLHMGLPCVVDRSGVSEQLVAMPCPDETDLFRLARTQYKAPRYRFEPPADQADDRGNWPRGMLPEWYPPGVRVYAPPRQPGLFDTGWNVPRKFKGKDPDKWWFS